MNAQVDPNPIPSVAPPTRQQPINSRRQSFEPEPRQSTPQRPPYAPESQQNIPQQSQREARLKQNGNPHSSPANHPLEPQIREIPPKSIDEQTRVQNFRERRRLSPALAQHKPNSTHNNEIIRQQVLSSQAQLVGSRPVLATNPLLIPQQYADSLRLAMPMSSLPQSQQALRERQRNDAIAVANYQRLQSERLASPFIAANYPHLIPGYIGASNLVRFGNGGVSNLVQIGNGIRMTVNSSRPSQLTNQTSASAPISTPIYRGEPIMSRSAPTNRIREAPTIPVSSVRSRTMPPKLRATISAASGSIVLTWDYEDPSQTEYSKVRSYI